MEGEKRRADADRPLRPSAAFVVQFAADSRPQGGSAGGRVEHIASGRSARFASVEELLAFFTAVLTQADAEEKG